MADLSEIYYRLIFLVILFVSIYLYLRKLEKTPTSNQVDEHQTEALYDAIKTMAKQNWGIVLAEHKLYTLVENDWVPLDLVVTRIAKDHYPKVKTDIDYYRFCYMVLFILQEPKSTANCWKGQDGKTKCHHELVKVVDVHLHPITKKRLKKKLTPHG